MGISGSKETGDNKRDGRRMEGERSLGRAGPFLKEMKTRNTGDSWAMRSMNETRTPGRKGSEWMSGSACCQPVLAKTKRNPLIWGRGLYNTMHLNMGTNRNFKPPTRLKRQPPCRKGGLLCVKNMLMKKRLPASGYHGMSGTSPRWCFCGVGVDCPCPSSKRRKFIAKRPFGHERHINSCMHVLDKRGTSPMRCVVINRQYRGANPFTALRAQVHGDCMHQNLTNRTPPSHRCPIKMITHGEGEEPWRWSFFLLCDDWKSRGMGSRHL